MLRRPRPLHAAAVPLACMNPSVHAAPGVTYRSCTAQVRKDPNLANLRASKEAFKAVIDKYDEPIINEQAIT